MDNWDFDNWDTVCKDCERYKTEIKLLQEKQVKSQEILVEKDKLVDDVKNFRELIVNTDLVYKNLSKANAAKQRIKDRNALYQERQKLMLSVMSRLIVLIFSSLHYLKLWEEEHKITKRAIDITVEQRQQLADKDVKLLGNEQLLKQYMALVAEQAEKLKSMADLEKEITNLKNELKRQSRQHKRTLERATSAFLEIMSQFHTKQKLSRKQIIWMEVCEKGMVGKKVPESVRYNPVFETTGQKGDADEDDGGPDVDNVGMGRKEGTLCRDVAVGASNYALSCDVGVDTEDLAAQVCGVAGVGLYRSGIAIAPGSDDGCSEKSPDSGIQLPQSPLSPASDCSNGSVESFRNSHNSMTVPSPPPLEDGYSSDPPISVDAARTSTPEVPEVLDSENEPANVDMSVEKQLENMFQQVEEVPGKAHLRSRSGRTSKEMPAPVDEKHSKTSGEVATQSIRELPDLESMSIEQNVDVCEGKENRSDNREANPHKVKQLKVKKPNVKSLDVLLFGDSDDMAEASSQQLLETAGEVNSERSESPVTVTRELWDTVATLTLPREKRVEVCEVDKVLPPSKSAKTPMRSIFDDPDVDEEEQLVGQRAEMALGEGDSACRPQVSVEQDLFGDTDEDDGWLATDDESQSGQEDGKRSCAREDEQMHAEVRVSECADGVEVRSGSEKTMIGNGVGASKDVKIASVFEQDLLADEDELVKLRKPPVKTLQEEGNRGSENVQITLNFEGSGKDDVVVHALGETRISNKGSVVDKGEQQVIFTESVTDKCEDEQHVNGKDGEAHVEDEGVCLGKQLISNASSSHTENGQKVCETIVCVEDKLRQQREETKSPEIDRMLAEFKGIFLLSPLSADVEEHTGEDQMASKRTEVNYTSAPDLAIIATTAMETTVILCEAQRDSNREEMNDTGTSDIAAVATAAVETIVTFDEHQRDTKIAEMNDTGTVATGVIKTVISSEGQRLSKISETNDTLDIANVATDTMKTIIMSSEDQRDYTIAEMNDASASDPATVALETIVVSGDQRQSKIAEMNNTGTAATGAMKTVISSEGQRRYSKIVDPSASDLANVATVVMETILSYDEDRRDSKIAEMNDTGTVATGVMNTVISGEAQRRDSKIAEMNDPSASDLANVATVAVVDEVGCATVKDVSYKADRKTNRSIEELLEHVNSVLIPDGENDAETAQSTQICRIGRNAMEHTKSQSSIINHVENNVVSKITSELKDCLDIYLTKLGGNTIKKPEFEEFITKEFTPFKKAITETLEAITVELTLQHKRHKVRGRRSEGSVQKQSKRKLSRDVSLPRKRSCSRVPQQNTSEDADMKLPERLARGQVLKSMCKDSLAKVDNTRESSESESDGGIYCMKSPTKLRRRLILSSPDSSDEEYENLKRQCEVRVFKVSLENVLSENINKSKINNSAVKVDPNKEIGEAKSNAVQNSCVERKNFGNKNYGLNSDAEHLNNGDECQKIDGEDIGKDEFEDGSEVVCGRPKRNCVRVGCIKSDAQPASKRQRRNSLLSRKEYSDDEHQPKILRRQRNNSVRMTIDDVNGTAPTVKLATRAHSLLNITDEVEKVEFKEKNATVCKESNIESTVNWSCDYKIPNAKPSRIAHKGKDDEQILLPDDIELNIKKQHLSNLLKSDTNFKLKPKIKKPSLLKKIISTCERKSKIRTVDENKTKTTRKGRRNVSVCNEDEDGLRTNYVSANQSNGKNCEENVSFSRLESSCSNSVDGFQTSVSEHCESDSSSQTQEHVQNGNEEFSQAGLQSANLEVSACSDDPDGCRTPTFTEYYKGKLLSRCLSDTRNDDVDGCKTPPLSEYYKTDLLSQKPTISDSNNINCFKTSATAVGYPHDHNVDIDDSDTQMNVEHFNKESQSSGFHPRERSNGDVCKTPDLSEYYKKELQQISSRRTSGYNDVFDDSTRDNITGVVKTSLDGAASKVSFQNLPLPSVRRSSLSASAVNEGVTLTNHLNSSFGDSPSTGGGSCQDFSPTFRSPIKSEYDVPLGWGGSVGSDPYEDDEWVYKVTPPVKSYARNRSGTSQPIKDDISLMLSGEMKSLAKNTTEKNVATLNKSILEDTVSVAAVVNDSDSSANTSDDAKEVIKTSGQARVLSHTNPLNSSVPVRSRPRHCAAVVVSKPAYSSPSIVKPALPVTANLPKPFYSVLEPPKPCPPVSKFPTSLDSASFDKPKTLQHANAEILTRLHSGPVEEFRPACDGVAEEPRTVCVSGKERRTVCVTDTIISNSLQGLQFKESRGCHNGTEEVSNVLQCVIKTEPKIEPYEIAEVPETASLRCPRVTAQGDMKAMPGISGGKKMPHSFASNESFGCKDNQPVSTALAFKDCWKEYFVRHQRRMFQDRKLNKPHFNQMEEFTDGILTTYLQKEMSQTSVDATVYGLVNCTRGMNNKILAICIVRAAMENIDQQYDEVARGVPHLTSTEHHLLALVFKLNTIKRFSGVKDMILSNIVYGMFRLCRTPQAGVLYALTRFYVLLCLRYGQYTHILMLCCDALFALSFGAFPVIYAALMLYDKALLRANVGKEHPLSLVISHVILSQHNSNNTPLFKVESLKNLLCRKYGYQRGEFMFRDVLRKLCDWLREGRVQYMERALIILAKKEPWHLVYKEVVQKQLMAMVTEWKEKKLSDTTVIVVVRLLGYIPRSFPRGPNTFGSISEVLKTLSGLLGRPGNTAQFEEAVITAVMALSNHCFNFVFPIVNLWKPLRPVPTTFFDVLYSAKNFKEWPQLLEKKQVKTGQQQLKTGQQQVKTG